MDTAAVKERIERAQKELAAAQAELISDPYPHYYKYLSGEYRDTVIRFDDSTYSYGQPDTGADFKYRPGGNEACVNAKAEVVRITADEFTAAEKAHNDPYPHYYTHSGHGSDAVLEFKTAFGQGEWIIHTGGSRPVFRDYSGQGEDSWAIARISKERAEAAIKEADKPAFQPFDLHVATEAEARGLWHRLNLAPTMVSKTLTYRPDTKDVPHTWGSYNDTLKRTNPQIQKDLNRHC
jgi:hypothetical protein